MKTLKPKVLFPRLAMLAGLSLACVSTFSVAPAKFESAFTQTNVVSDLAPFDITIVANVTSSETDYFDNAGRVVRAIFHQTEQDVYSANGKSLTSLPYTFNVELTFDTAGNLIKATSAGLTTRIPLPDGSLFIGAGRVDILNHPTATFILSPDHGNPGNVAGFIAALSP